MKALQKAFKEKKRQAEQGENYLATIACHTGLKTTFLLSVVRGANKKYRRKYVDILYNYFKLPQDKRYKKNLRAWE